MSDLEELEERFVECEGCGVIFESEWSEEECQEEKQKLWGDIPEEDCCTVCDDCFQKIMVQFN